MGRYANWDDFRKVKSIASETDRKKIQQAIDRADAEIITAALQAKWFNTPFKPIGDDVERVKRWSVVLTEFNLAGSSPEIEEIRADMQRAFGPGSEIEAARRGPIAVW